MLAIQMLKFNLTYSSDQIMFFSMLNIWKFRYSKFFFFIKCVVFKPIFFAISLDIVSSSKVFTNFDLWFYRLYC